MSKHELCKWIESTIKSSLSRILYDWYRFTTINKCCIKLVHVCVHSKENKKHFNLWFYPIFIKHYEFTIFKTLNHHFTHTHNKTERQVWVNDNYSCLALLYNSIISFSPYTTVRAVLVAHAVVIVHQHYLSRSPLSHKTNHRHWHFPSIDFCSLFVRLVHTFLVVCDERLNSCAQISFSNRILQLTKW